MAPSCSLYVNKHAQKTPFLSQMPFFTLFFWHSLEGSGEKKEELGDEERRRFTLLCAASIL